MWSFLYLYSISIENLFSISFSMSFTDINLFSISLSFSYWNNTALHPSYSWRPSTVRKLSCNRSTNTIDSDTVNTFTVECFVACNIFVARMLPVWADAAQVPVRIWMMCQLEDGFSWVRCNASVPTNNWRVRVFVHSQQNCCYQMSDFKAKMHQILYSTGVPPIPHSAPPDLSSWVWGAYF